MTDKPTDPSQSLEPRDDAAELGATAPMPTVHDDPAPRPRPVLPQRPTERPAVRPPSAQIGARVLTPLSAPPPLPPESGGGSGTGGGTGGGTVPFWRNRTVLVVAGAVVGALLLVYVVLFATVGNALARGATVAGIDVGGMSAEEAEAKLRAELPALVDAPVNVTVHGDEATYEITPSAAGLTIDIPATVDAVPGGSANPLSLIKAALGADEITPVPSVDRAALEAAVASIAEQSDTPAVNGAVAFDSGTVVTSEPVVGHAVDVSAAADTLAAAYFGSDDATLPIGAVTVPSAEVAPAVSSEEVARAVSEFAEPAMSAPVTVVAGDKSADIDPEMLSEALTMTPDEGGTLQPALDGAALAEAAEDELAEIGQEGQDASVRIENGGPVVVPAKTGKGVSPEALSAAVLPALTQTGDAREAVVELAEIEPELTTEAAEKLGVTEVVGEFTTQFPHADYRNVNIGTAAERIDDTLLLPGEEFSLNGIVGERTEANGFTAGTIINGGRLKEEMGGGVSQVATTTFHAAFKAGLEDVEHWPHSIYFDRYPIGQEATVVWGAKDMRFANDTPYGVVVDTSFTASTGSSPGTLTVRIWSTPYYKSELSVSERYDFTDPQTVYDSSENCQAQTGSKGFSITSYRKVWTLDGTLVKDETDPWTYNPNHTVICGEEPKGGGGD